MVESYSQAARLSVPKDKLGRTRGNLRNKDPARWSGERAIGSPRPDQISESSSFHKRFDGEQEISQVHLSSKGSEYSGDSYRPRCIVRPIVLPRGSASSREEQSFKSSGSNSDPSPKILQDSQKERRDVIQSVSHKVALCKYKLLIQEAPRRVKSN